MLPGPNQILRLPTSGKLVKITTLLSGNTFGAQFWTDGKREAPMLPDSPWLRCHPEGREFFWTDECEEVGEEDAWGKTSQYGDVPYAEDPELDDYRRALTSLPGLPREKEQYLRMRYWWAANDPVRRGEIAQPTADGYRENLERLISLLDVTAPNSRLMAAEATRQLGDFEQAASLLQFDFGGDYVKAVERIGALVRRHDTVVRGLTE
jgi:hypothetical protein